MYIARVVRESAREVLDVGRVRTPTHQNPTSTPGRILDVAMEVYAITVVASLAGAIGAFLVKRGRELEHARAEKDVSKPTPSLSLPSP